MIVYQCENCGKMIIWGCINEYNQHFCNEICYKKYCEKNGYKFNLEELYKIRTVFDNHT